VPDSPASPGDGVTDRIGSDKQGNRI